MTFEKTIHQLFCPISGLSETKLQQKRLNKEAGNFFSGVFLLFQMDKENCYINFPLQNDTFFCTANHNFAITFRFVWLISILLQGNHLEIDTLYFHFKSKKLTNFSFCSSPSFWLTLLTVLFSLTLSTFIVSLTVPHCFNSSGDKKTELFIKIQPRI